MKKKKVTLIILTVIIFSTIFFYFGMKEKGNWFMGGVIFGELYIIILDKLKKRRTASK